MTIEYEVLEAVVNKGFPIIKTTQAEKWALFSIFIGLLFAVLLPYLFKVYQDERVKFDYQYFTGAVIAGILAFLMFSGQPIPEGMTLLRYCLQAFITGASVDTLINQGITTREDTKR